MNAYHIVAAWGLIVILIGIGLVVYGFTFFADKLDLEKNGITVPGTVIDINSKPPYRAPIVRFTTRDNRTITFLSRLDVNVRLFNYTVGQKVEVIYHRNNPNNCQINSFWEKNIGNIALWGLGLIAMTGGWLLRRHYLKRAREFG